MKIKALIVDDEAPARSEMRYLLEKFSEVEILGEAGTADEALKLIASIDYDIAFVDIDMPGMTGLEMAEKIGEMKHQPAVVFTTAYGQYAVKAFEVDAADYLVKPVSEDRLKSAIDRVIKGIEGVDESGNQADAPTVPKLFDRVPVTRHSKTVLLAPAEIYFIESHGEFTVINSVQGTFVSPLRLKDFEVRLSPKSFFRSHRSFVVNLDYVSEMTALYGGLYMLKIKNNAATEIPVSRRQTKNLKSLLGMR